MRVVIMIDKSAGNAEVGQMWTECFEFDETSTISDVLKKCPEPDSAGQFRNTVRIQLLPEVEV